MKCYLATTGISEIWNLEKNLLLLGPWCLTAEKNKGLLEGRKYCLVPSPWKPASRIKEALDYCHNLYEQLMPQFSQNLNFVHQTRYPERYWRILIGPWLLQFIGVLYDRYKRIEKAMGIFPHLYTQALPRQRCRLAYSDTYDFYNKVNQDYYNLKLFSLAAYELCPDNIIVKDYNSENKIHTRRYSLKRKLYNRIAEVFDSFSKGSIVLADMYHLTHPDMFIIGCKTGFRRVRFIDFEPAEEKLLSNKYSSELRKKMKLKETADRFQSLLYKVLPEALPMCYMENYKFYKTSIDNISNTSSIRVVGSSVGWLFNERFKFFAAEVNSNEPKLNLEFQHGGGYGISLSSPVQLLALERDIFYTWGWHSRKDDKFKPLPSPRLSRLKNTYSPRLDKVLFISTATPRYLYRLHTTILADDMPKYFEDKRIFFQALPGEIKNKLLYRPYPCDYGWKEIEIVKKICPNAKFLLKGKLSKWMQKVKLAVIDHPHTSFIEALATNVPTILYWDHQAYLIKADSEKYFELLREAGIVYNNPKEAAQKAVEVFSNPLDWWSSEKIQKARNAFLEQIGYAKKNWMDYWVKEIHRLSSSI